MKRTRRTKIRSQKTEQRPSKGKSSIINGLTVILEFLTLIINGTKNEEYRVTAHDTIILLIPDSLTCQGKEKETNPNMQFGCNLDNFMHGNDLELKNNFKKCGKYVHVPVNRA